jgi:thymidylate synthase (FAD)
MAKATLVNWTPKPLETVYWAFMNMHNKIPDSLEDLDISEDELVDFIGMLIKQPHTTVFEFVNTVWKFDGVSRAFQQQLTRTRQASYSIQSLRIVDVENFADNNEFLIPDNIAQNEKALKLYKEAMKSAQSYYRELIDTTGADTQDARNVLPLSVHSPITMSIDFRALIHMAELRLCENTQGEFKEIVAQMKEEVNNKMHPLLAECLKPICFRTKKCVSVVPCDKYNFEKDVKIDVSRWIKG